MDDQFYYLTAQSLEALKKELETIKNIAIPEIAKNIDEAKQQGDLSENAEYHEARDQMAWAQTRAQELEQIITNAKIITPQNTGTVNMGSSVVVKVNGAERNYSIVGPQEANPGKGMISNESPLGATLMGHKVGDNIDIMTPAGKQTYTVIKIS